MAGSSRSAPAPALFRRRYGACSTIGIVVAASRAAGFRSAPTTLSNLALLCRRHHRAVHEEGYQVDRRPDGELRFWRPDGRPLPEVPSPPKVVCDPVHALRAPHEAQGLRLHARTAWPGWLGERLDVGWAIDVLHP